MKNQAVKLTLCGVFFMHVILKCVGAKSLESCPTL